VTIKQLYVAGAGLMGAGVAQTAISHGFDVTIREVDDNLVNHGV
jgi:3-hydroxybutyryl-CoA dehydrogenase